MEPAHFPKTREIYWNTRWADHVGLSLQPDARQTAEGVGRPEAAAINFIRGGRFALVVDGRGAGDRGPYAVTVGPVDAGEDCGTAIDLPVVLKAESTYPRNPLAIDGPFTRLPADYLVRDGTIERSRVGRRLDDGLELDDVLRWAST